MKSNRLDVDASLLLDSPSKHTEQIGPPMAGEAVQ
jgi:hypothetical protein